MKSLESLLTSLLGMTLTIPLAAQVSPPAAEVSQAASASDAAGPANG